MDFCKSLWDMEFASTGPPAEDDPRAIAASKGLADMLQDDGLHPAFNVST